MALCLASLTLLTAVGERRERGGERKEVEGEGGGREERGRGEGGGREEEGRGRRERERKEWGGRRERGKRSKQILKAKRGNSN